MTDDAIDIIAKAINESMNDPESRTMYDMAGHVMEALTKAGYAVVLVDACPHCGAGNVGECRLPKCLWTN